MDIKDILPFIPQRAPFVMVDELVAVGEETATTRFSVRADNLFIKNGLLTEPALIENMAQTAAARIGFICIKKNEPVPVGFIGAVQNLEVIALPATGEELETEIRIKNQVFDVTIITGRVVCKNKLLAQCEMKIFLQPNIQS
ncbi:MAG TPA: 3-hydroxyacyl-ACP dehydratase [Agriterribacter sp.]|nr:3-hydroxyacyl-ACP dehydratase [Agriterribacter sp.]